MAHLILVTGGARSGKSTFAESLTEPFAGNRTYIATAPVPDEEMAHRVKLHQELRNGKGWNTIEEETELVSALKQARANGTKAVLVDCLTLWINNLLYHNPDFREENMAETASKLLKETDRFPGLIVFVLNEVGMGIVPENKISRTFRDCSGRCGQLIAQHADEVWLCVCGIPVKINGA